VSENIQYKTHRTHSLKPLAAGAILGGILGALMGILQIRGLLYVPILQTIANMLPLGIILVSILIGIIIGGIIGGIISLFIYLSRSEQVPSEEESKFELREEKLDITKKLVHTGQVNIHKEVITEEKTIKVPVNREELVIESTVKGKENDPIRIPIMEEQIEVIKHPVALEDVSYHIEEYTENKCITEMLKKEELITEKDGFTTIVDKVAKDPPELK
jgi:uncharacterized protein (TIGR02271 family)